MTEYSLDLDLYVDETQSPPAYLLKTKTHISGTTEEFEAGEALLTSEIPDENGRLHYELNLIGLNPPAVGQNPVEHSHCPPFGFDEINVEVKLSDTTVTSGTVKTEEAQQETRPWD